MAEETGFKKSSDRSASGGRSGGYSSRGGPGGRSSSGPPGGRGKGRPMRRRVCRVCVDRGGHVDWKAVNTLRNYISDRGKIMSARQTATCAACQRKVTKAVKTAQMMALLPITAG